MVKINGKQEKVAGMSLAAYLEKAGYDRTRTAVEINGEIVVKAAYDETVINDGDEIEIVSFVGGG